MITMMAPKPTATEGVGIRCAIMIIAAASHAGVIAVLMSVQIQPPSPVAPQVLTVSVDTDEAPVTARATAPTIGPATGMQQQKQQPASKPKKTSPKKPAANRNIPAPPITAETPIKETGDATPAHVSPSFSAPLEASGTGAVAPIAETTAAVPGPLTPPRFDVDYLANPAPPYPPASRSMGEQGKVSLNVLVSPTGAATEVKVRTGSGFERLDQAALEAVRHWKFVPARRGDETVAAWVVVPILFSLRR